MAIYFNQSLSKPCQKKTLVIFSEAKKKSANYLQLQDIDFYFTLDVNVTPVQNERMTAISYETGAAIVTFFQLTYHKKELLSLLFHEFNHLARNNLFSTELKPTLFNWMLLEGLAAEFEEWVMQRFYNCKAISAHKNTCSINELKLRLQQIIQIDKNKSSWDHYDWFYNFDRQANLPINCAYQVGAWLVKNYCEQNQLLPHQALKVSSQKFLRFGSALCEK